jgi:hypothetical protein
MKKIVYVLAFIGAIFTGCNPIEDINKDLAAEENPVIGAVEYTLTDDDYAELELGFGSFSSDEDARTDIPGLLSAKYPFFGNGSSALVTYNLFIGSAEGVSDYTGSDVYSLSNSDYALTGSDAFGFYPNVDATDEIPAVLDIAITAPTEGQIVLAEYDQYTEIPQVGLANVEFYDFAAGFGDWVIVEESGADAVWTEQPGNVRGNGFFGDQFANVEWLVSPSVDLTAEENLKFQITQELDFAGDTSLIKILVSTDYTGDVLTATWDEIMLAMPATGTMAPSEDYDFSAYDGQTINVAFKYTSIADDPATVGVDEGDAARWRIESLAIKTLGATGDSDSKGEYFVYEGGSWEASEGVYYLSSADYDSMGEESGQPGRFDNFSSSTPASAYLDTFLGIKYPFAQEEDQIFVIYKYFSSNSGLGTRGNEYIYTNGEWVGHESTIETSLQFGLENGVWVPDNTIRYTLMGSDYSFAASELLTVTGYEAAAGNLDNFGNFNRTGDDEGDEPSGTTNWNDLMLLRALNIVLDNINPSAAEGQKYIATVATWAPGNSTEDFALIKQGGEWVLQ